MTWGQGQADGVNSSNVLHYNDISACSHALDVIAFSRIKIRALYNLVRVYGACASNSIKDPPISFVMPVSLATKKLLKNCCYI
jgi:hypothetical protein